MFRQPEIQDLARNQFDTWSGQAGRQLPTPEMPRSMPGPVSWAAPRMSEATGQIPYAIGSSLPNMAGDRAVLRPLGNFLSTLGYSPAKSLLYGLLAGGAAGAGVGFLNPRHSMLGSALLGAGIGGAGAYGLSSLMQGNMNAKRRAWKEERMRSKMASSSGGALDEVARRLAADYSLSGGQKSLLIQMLESVSGHQAEALASALRFAGGASVGMLVARFLLGLGMGGSALMGILGGTGALAMLGGGQNAYGQTPTLGADVFGRQRMV